MTHGFDTGFLVAFEVTGDPDQAAARVRIRVCHSDGDDFALAPQVLAEFISCRDGSEAIYFAFGDRGGSLA
jgi:hypothetical protein